MKIAVLCPSEIALRRFMPALTQTQAFEFAGIGVASPTEWFAEALPAVPAEKVAAQQQQEHAKAKIFTEQFGGKIYSSYQDLITSTDVDAVYVPLPPGLHYRWAKTALQANKHVLVEKPAATALEDAQQLISSAEERHLALHENYMFVFHRQLDEIERITASGEIGDIRLIRISFGFPMRAANDFRYKKELGGGALLDCGGYTIRYASRLLGKTARLVTAQTNFIPQFSVDMYGSATMVNDKGVTAQLAFGMDNNYKCDLEIWGSLGTIFTGRVLTAPAGFIPSIVIRKGNDSETRNLPADDAFKKSICHFKECIEKQEIRQSQYDIIGKQAEFIDDFYRLSGMVPLKFSDRSAKV